MQLSEKINESEFIPQVPRFGNRPISAELSIYCYLWFIANTESLRLLANLFGIGTTSVFRVIRRVVDWLNSISEDVIKWPKAEQIRANSEKFFNKSGIRGIAASLDSTSIHILKPKVNGEGFYNRKKYHSVNLQAVVDAEMRFINVYAGQAGALHDARVFRLSPLSNFTPEQQRDHFPNNEFIVGDSAYPGLSYLVTSFRNTGHLTENQVLFNTMWIILHANSVETKQKESCLPPYDYNTRFKPYN